MKLRPTRRSVLAAAGLTILPSSRTAFSFAANERVRLAVLGHMYNADHFFTSVHAYNGVELAAVCNPDQRKFLEVFKGWEEQVKKAAGSDKPQERKGGEYYQRLLDNRPPVFADFRRMLAETPGGIDALVVSLYDHYHGVACGAAMRAGIHVFSERPLGLTIGESRALADLAVKQKVATSIRNPGNASNAFRRGIELVREGVIGPVQEVHVWFDRGGPDRDKPPAEAQPAPQGLEWDLWLGPVAQRPYHADWMAYATWRETSNGGIGTFGPHAANLAFMALNLADLWKAAPAGAPPRTIRVRAECNRINRLSFPKWEKIRWSIPARGEMPAVTFTWYNGPGHVPEAREMLTRIMADRGADAEEHKKLLGYAGALLVGGRGVMATDDHNVKFTLLPKREFEGVAQDKPKALPPSRGHYNDWLHAIRGGEPAWANFSYANPLSELLMLGNIATQFDDELEFDPVAGRFVNHAEADRLLSYQYRDGWTL